MSCMGAARSPRMSPDDHGHDTVTKFASTDLPWALAAKQGLISCSMRL